MERAGETTSTFWAFLSKLSIVVLNVYRSADTQTRDAHVQGCRVGDKVSSGAEGGKKILPYPVCLKDVNDNVPPYIAGEKRYGSLYFGKQDAYQYSE